jgi:hypothetical protein
VDLLWQSSSCWCNKSLNPHPSCDGTVGPGCQRQTNQRARQRNCLGTSMDVVGWAIALLGAGAAQSHDNCRHLTHITLVHLDTGGLEEQRAITNQYSRFARIPSSVTACLWRC